jgi:hypothetical protein
MEPTTKQAFDQTLDVLTAIRDMIGDLGEEVMIGAAEPKRDKFERTLDKTEVAVENLATLLRGR